MFPSLRLYMAAAVLLTLVLLLRGVSTMTRRSPNVGEWIRTGTGVLVLLGVVAVGAGLLSRASGSDGAARQWVAAFSPKAAIAASPATITTLPVEGTLPSLAGATAWLNSAPLTRVALRGKVVLVDFWTYSCVNCLRALPYVEAWSRKYRQHGLVVIGVHTPEFPFEKDEANVAAAVQRLGVGYPVALDSDYTIWRAFNNQFWPADYFIDAQGRIRHHYFGEGGYREGEDVIRQLLTAAGYAQLPGGYVQPDARGAQAAVPGDTGRSPETYVGYARAENFAGGRLADDSAFDYRAPAGLGLDEWALHGRWKVRADAAVLEQAQGKIVFRFRGRDLHLVLGPAADGEPVRFRVTLDGKAPGADHGADIDAQGDGAVIAQRLYQLVRQHDGHGERVFTITFLDAGVHAYAFTFG